MLKTIKYLVRMIDAASTGLAWGAAWALLLACILAGANAVLRYAFNMGSNAWLEAQWYLFAMAAMLGAPYLLLLNEHVRVDVWYGNLSPKTKARIDAVGLAVVLVPVCLWMVWVSAPFVADAYLQQEHSPNAGGLLRWPFKALLPLGFACLAVQGCAEWLKRTLFIAGVAPEYCPHYEKPPQ